MINAKDKIKAGIISCSSIGDSLLFLIIANNLKQNNFNVTFYSSILYDLRNWIKDINVEPSLTLTKEFIYCCSHNDIVFVDRAANVTEFYSLINLHEIPFNCIFISISNIKFGLFNFDYQQRFSSHTNDSNKLQRLLQFAQIKQTVIARCSTTVPMVERVKIFCQQILCLKCVTIENGLQPPHSLVYRKNIKRVIIHPASHDAKKNWPVQKFILLARKLQNDGWQVVFTVSPVEWDKWRQITPEGILLPKFPSILQLAEYVYESGYMIGNDSGVGHLASNLKIPTVTIIKKRDKFYRWRPGWYINKLVIPIFSFQLFKFFPKRFYYLPVSRVVKIFYTLVYDIT